MCGRFVQIIDIELFVKRFGVKDPKNKGRELLIPVDHGSTTKYDSTVKKDLKLEGMGRNRRKEDPLGRQGKLF